MLELSDIDLAGRYRQPLEELARQQCSRRRFYGMLAVLLFALALMVAIPVAHLVALSLALVVGVVIAAPALWLSIVALRYQVVTKPRLARRLDFRVAERLRWQGGRALEIVGVDEDPQQRAFVLDDGSGQLLFLQGECLREALEAGTFPNSDIELVWGPQRRFFIGLFINGSALQYSEIHYGELDIDGVWLPNSGDTIAGSVDSFAADFKKHIDG